MALILIIPVSYILTQFMITSLTKIINCEYLSYRLLNPVTNIARISRVSEGLQYWGAEGILYRVMKLENLMVSKVRESGTILSQKIFQF